MIWKKKVSLFLLQKLGMSHAGILSRHPSAPGRTSPYLNN